MEIPKAKPEEKAIIDALPRDGGYVELFDDGRISDEMLGRVIREILRSYPAVVVGWKED
jgi:hypothetical protein